MSQRPTRAALLALQGFALGATLGALCHLGNLAATLVVGTDDASRRMSAELVKLGHENFLFVVAATLAVA